MNHEMVDPQRCSAMPDVVFSELDMSSEQTRARYESALYRAFAPSLEAPLESIRIYDHKARRMRTVIAYESQRIFAARLDEAIIASVAINYNTEEKMQIEHVGFSIDKSQKGICEGLSLFSLPVLQNSLMVVALLGRHVFEHLKKEGINRVYSACDKKRLRGYTRLGWKELDSRAFSGITAYLIVRETNEREISGYSVF